MNVMEVYPPGVSLARGANWPRLKQIWSSEVHARRWRRRSFSSVRRCSALFIELHISTTAASFFLSPHLRLIWSENLLMLCVPGLMWNQFKKLHIKISLSLSPRGVVCAILVFQRWRDAFPFQRSAPAGDLFTGEKHLSTPSGSKTVHGRYDHASARVELFAQRYVWMWRRRLLCHCVIVC